MTLPPYERWLALKLLLRAHRQRFIPVVAVLAVAGVALGVAALMVVLAVMSGFERDLQSKITAMSAHIWVQPFGMDADAGRGDTLERLAAAPHVTGAGLYLSSQALLQTSRAATGAVLFGLDGHAAASVVELGRHLKFGRLPEFGSAAAEVVLGSELAQSLGAWPGDTVVLLTASRLTQTIPNLLKVKVVGVFEAGMYEYDAHTAYLPLLAMRRFVGRQARAGALVRVDDMFRASAVARDLQARLGARFLARDWLSLNRNLFFAIRTEKVVMFLILLTIVTVAAFNITSSLIMTVMEKTRAIGVLATLGVPPRRIAGLFVWQGALVGGGGVLAGTLLGLALCGFISVYPLALPGGGSVYYLSTLPVRMNWWLDLAVIPGIALLLCLAAAWFPARQASRLDPVEAVRYE